MLSKQQALDFLAESVKHGPHQVVADEERKGQQDFLTSASEMLPAEVEPEGAKEVLEKAGVEFLGPADDELFQLVRLPAGWKRVASGHPWLSMLIDDQDRERARIFYKPNHYQRVASLILAPRFGIHESCHDTSQLESEAEYLAYVTDGGVVTDCGKTLHVTEVAELEGDRLQRYRITRQLIKQARVWLDENYPDWMDSFAYWED